MIDALIKTAETGKTDALNLGSLEVKKTKLLVAEGVSELSTKTIYFFVNILLLSFVFFFVAMGTAFLLNDLIPIPGIGFFIMALFFLLIILLIKIFYKKWIEKPIVKMYINLLFKRSKGEE